MRNFLMAALAGTALVAALPASAATITYQSWFSPNNGPAPGDGPRTYTATDFTGVAEKIVLPRFDSALGTLTGATLTFYADANSVGQLTNTSPNKSSTITSYNASLRVHLLAPSAAKTGPGITSPATATTPFLIEVLPSLLTISNVTLGPGQAIGFNRTAASSTGSIDLFASSSLPFFQGIGTVTLPVFTNTRTVSSASGGNLKLTQTTEARAEAIVTYVYTAAPVSVPEPMTLTLLGGSLLGLSLVRRRG